MTLTTSFSQNKIKPNNAIYWIMCIVFCGLYFLRDVIGIGISYYIIYFLVALIVLTISKEKVIAFVISIAAFTNAGFDGLFSLMLLLCIMIRFIDYLKTIKWYSLLLIVMCLIEGFHFLSTDNVAVGTIITYISIILILLIIQQYPYEKTDSKLIVNSFIIFSLFFVLVTVIRMWQVCGSLEVLLQTGFRNEEYTSIRNEDGLTANQNYITSLCSLNMGLCTLMISKKMPKFPYLIAIVIFTISGLLTISKMFIAVIVAFVVYVSYITLKKNFLKGIGITAIFAVFIFVGIQLFGDSLIQMVIKRFETGDLTTGRVSIIESLLGYMNEHPLTYICGMGIMQSSYYIGRAVHSSLFEIIGGWGFIGVFVVVIYIVALITNSRKAAVRKNCIPNEFSYLPIIMLLGYSLIGMLFSSSYGILKMMVAIYAIQIGEHKRNEI